MKKEPGLLNSSGQSLPLAVLAMGLIIGVAALTIDYGKVLGLRNESQTATSAAVLAAAKSLDQSLTGSSGQISFSSSSGTIAVALPDLQTADTQANQVYQDNILPAISHSSNLNTVTLTYSESLTGSYQSAQQFLQSHSSGIQLPLYIRASASGSTTMNFGSALGIPSAQVKPVSTAVLEADTQAAVNSNFVPLGMPTDPSGNNTCFPQSYLPGSTYFAYRGDSGGNTPPASPMPIKFLGVYGPGTDGWLKLSQKILQVGANVMYVKSKSGSSPWNRLPFQAGDRVILPLVYVKKDTCTTKSNDSPHGQVKLTGFITAKIDSVDPNSEGSHAGFTFTVLSDTAENDVPASPSTAIQSSMPYWFYYSLVPNS